MLASVGGMSSPTRSAVILALVLGLTWTPGCRPDPWLQPDPRHRLRLRRRLFLPGAEPEPAVAVATPSPLLLHASDVGGEHDELLPDDRIRAEYEPSDPWLGAEQPLVTIVAYLDYQCPFSRKLLPTLYELAAIHPEDLRVVFRHYPLAMHPDARFAAIAATAAQQQGRFWAMHDALFENSRQLDRDSVITQAGRLGLDLELFRRSLDDPELAARIDADLDRAQDLGINATPSLVINGRLVTGARPLEELQDEYRKEQNLAQRLLDAGASRSSLYAHLMHAARDVAPVAARSDSPADGIRREISTAGLPRKGAADPRVVIVECADFDCPFCKRAAPVLDELLANHPDDVALFFRHFPLAFHTGAEPAARAAIAAQEQGKFWKMHDLLFAKNKERSDAELEKLARKAGLELGRFRKALSREDTAARVKAEIATCQADGVSGTPTFFINGRLMSGARPIADFEAVVAEELERRP